MNALHESSRLIRGLKARLEMFCPISESKSPAEYSHSLAGQVYANRVLKPRRGSRHLKDEVDRAEVIGLGLRLKAGADQSALFRRLGTIPGIDAVGILTMGEIFSPAELDRSSVRDLADIDYSLANINLLVELLTEKADSGFSRIAEQLLTSRLGELGSFPIATCSSLRENIAKFGVTSKLSTISHIGDAFYALKQTYWPLFGSDLLVFFQTLADPTGELSFTQTETLLKLSHIWGLGPLASRLVLLRALNNYEGERKYFEANSTALLEASGLPTKLVNRISSKNYDEAEYLAPSSTDEDPLLRAILFSQAFYALLEKREFNKLLLLIASQYERDVIALSFIDWDSFHAQAPVDWGQNYTLNILLAVILLSPSIVMRFESIEYAYGEGSVTNQIINYVEWLKAHRQGMYQFARSISALPQNARNAVAQFLLQKSVIEVYAYSFRDKAIITPAKIPAAELEVCQARIRLAFMFRESNAVPPDLCDRIISEESAFRKMYRFQTVFRTSRIRIDWKYLTMEISEALQVDFGHVFEALRKRGAAPASTLASILSTLISQRVCQLTLFESATSLERALSNNLRHGVVVPRFLRAFTEAISSQDSDAPKGGRTNRGWYQSIFNRAGDRLYALEVEIIECISSYQDDWLKVFPDGPLDSELQEQLTSVLIKNISKASHFNIEELVAELIVVQRNAIENILKNSREILLGRIRAQVQKCIGLANIDIDPLDSRASREFLDSLSVCMEQAFEQVAGWISVVDYESGHSSEFELGDLIDEESNTFFIAAKSQKRIKFECQDRRSVRQRRLRDVAISGRAFELFDQIVHNNISNAHKRSGLGNNTKILIRVTLEPSDIVFWCGNNFDSALLKKMRNHQTRAKQIISGALSGRPQKRGLKKVSALNREGGYGFIKIIDECQRILGTTPAFNFPIIKSESSDFIVEIRLPGAISILA